MDDGHFSLSQPTTNDEAEDIGGGYRRIGDVRYLSIRLEHAIAVARRFARRGRLPIRKHHTSVQLHTYRCPWALVLSTQLRPLTPHVSPS